MAGDPTYTSPNTSRTIVMALATTVVFIITGSTVTVDGTRWRFWGASQSYKYSVRHYQCHCQSGFRR